MTTVLRSRARTPRDRKIQGEASDVDSALARAAQNARALGAEDYARKLTDLRAENVFAAADAMGGEPCDG